MDFYQRLGDLLKQTLDNGEIVFIKTEDVQNQSKSDFHKSQSQSSPNPTPKGNEFNESPILKNRSSHLEYERPLQNGTIYHGGEGLNFSPDNLNKNFSPQKKLSPEIERAFRFFNLSPDSSMEEIKKAYKEKIKYYHPDKYQGNDVLLKIATDKTKQAVEYYDLICKWSL